uniref:Caspase family p20 domain-containing protein n=1 Tax=Sinocyclocheilus grahami TaxID=75366 RepID=A0A672LTH2_SINGR
MEWIFIFRCTLYVYVVLLLHKHTKMYVFVFRVRDALNAFRDSLSNGYVSCFILVIMAHGVQDYHDNIFQMFDNRQCPAMRGKPKLFIVQACRGDVCHSMGYPSLLCDSGGFSSPCHGLPTLLPTMSDYMKVYAAQPGHVAFRNPDHGSPLFTVLMDVVEEFGKTRHMREIFTMVKISYQNILDWAQVGQFNPPDNSLHVEDGLSKKWYLFHT